MKAFLFTFSLVVLWISGFPQEAGNSEFNYPITKKVNQLDNYHGTEVQDSYRWLENDTSAATAAWVKDQNKVTFDYLSEIPFRNALKTRLTELINYPRESAPISAGEYYLYYGNSGLQNQDVIYIKKGLTAKPTVFIDPNKLSTKGTVSLRLAGISKNGRYVVLSRSQSGSDWRSLIVMDVTTGRPTGDTLNWVKFSGASWNGSGFYYSRYPKPEPEKSFSASNRLHSVYYHNLGEPQSKDELIYQDESHPQRYHWADVTEDEMFLVLYIAEGTDGYECHVRPIGKQGAAFIPLFTGFENKSEVIDHKDGKLLVKTNFKSPMNKLVSIDPLKPELKHWTEVIPEKAHLLQHISTAGGCLFATYLERAQNKVYRSDYAGRGMTEIALPAPGSVSGFSGKAEDTILFYHYSSFTCPGNIFKYSLPTGQSAIYYKPKLSFNPDDYVSSQVAYGSKDGTEITMFIVHKKGLEMNGKHPLMLYGYGGFNVSLTPNFSTSRIPWLENGGIFAMPNLRGGGEYGENWHREGMLLNKQNVFDDFISAAEFLIANGYTSKERLVISGRSNGGLLVAAVMTQRPDLMKVALPGVGVMDMLRYDKFTVGHGWVPEYGSSDDTVHFKNLFMYSPLHNLHQGMLYPATLIYTADHDDRVVPAHSFKFAARLQAVQAGTNPVMIRIETEAGHGGGKPISKIIEEEADKLAFSFYNIGVSPLH